MADSNYTYMIFKMISGDELVGRVVLTEPLDGEVPVIVLHDPQWIVTEENGSMKLRDALMLAAQDTMPIHLKDVLTMYKPHDSLVQYYTAAVIYNRRARPEFHTQTLDAAHTLYDTIREQQMEEAVRAARAAKASKKSLN